MREVKKRKKARTSTMMFSHEVEALCVLYPLHRSSNYCMTPAICAS